MPVGVLMMYYGTIENLSPSSFPAVCCVKQHIQRMKKHLGRALDIDNDLQATSFGLHFVVKLLLGISVAHYVRGRLVEFQQMMINVVILAAVLVQHQQSVLILHKKRKYHITVFFPDDP